MSRFLDQIRKAKEAREAALRRGEQAGKSGASASEDAAGTGRSSGAEAAAPSEPPPKLFPDELSEEHPRPPETPAKPPEAPAALFPPKLGEECLRPPEISAEVSESSAALFPAKLEEERAGAAQDTAAPGKPTPLSSSPGEEPRFPVPEASAAEARASEREEAEAVRESGEESQEKTVSEPEPSFVAASEPEPVAVVPPVAVRPTAPPKVSVPSSPKEPAPAASLFPPELEAVLPPAQGDIGGKREGGGGRTESVLFVEPSGAQTETHPSQAFPRLRRAKGEIPVPGPEPDPAFVNRIVRVAPRPDKRALAFYEPKHHICEEYRLLGKNLLHAFANGSENLRRGKVITLTSSVRNEGKTLTCMNLALILAQDYGDRVLLLDADMRHPKLHRYLGLPPSTGFNDLLASSAPETILTDSVVRTDTGLHLLTAQSTKGNPAPLLDSPNMTRILNLLREHYSLIIMDTPPVLLATDALTLGARSDGMLFLLRARKTKREQIQEARQRIARLEIRLLGYIINNVRTFLPKIWSRYYYGEY